jgi:hypothetical protein
MQLIEKLQKQLRFFRNLGFYMRFLKEKIPRHFDKLVDTIFRNTT